MPIIFIIQKVIMWDSKTSLAFWRPKNFLPTALLSRFPLRSVSRYFQGHSAKWQLSAGPFHVRLGALKKKTKKNVTNFLSSKHTDPVFLTPWRKQNDYRSHHWKPAITKFFHYAMCWRLAGKMKHGLKNTVITEMVQAHGHYLTIYELHLWGSEEKRWGSTRDTVQ